MRGQQQDDYGELVEIDVLRPGNNSNQNNQQAHSGSNGTNYSSVYQNNLNGGGAGASYSNNGQVYDTTRNMSVPDYSRPLTARSSMQSQQQPVHPDDYVSSPGWAPSPGANAPFNGHFPAEPPYESRSSTPTLRSGQATPIDQLPNLPHLPPPRPVSSIIDSRPSTPTVRSSRLSLSRSTLAASAANVDSVMNVKNPNYEQNQSFMSLTALLPQSPSPVPPDKDSSVVTSSISSLHKRDDVEIFKGWRRHVHFFVPFLTFANTALYILYLVIRIAFVVSAQNKFHATYAAAWLFIAVEIATTIPPTMHNGWTMMALKKRKRPRLRLTGVDVPTVDVFITCCGEDDDVVLDTVRAACDQDYPRDRFRVVILDDGKSEGLAKACGALNVVYGNVFYMARPKYPGVPHHFKAGNLNYGLDEVHRLPGGAGQFMGALDADMIPERDWLRGVLPHLLIDPKMGLACPPQLFYNVPKSDPLAQSLNFFVHVIEPIKDAMGVAWCTGSGYVARREALDSIGNFPLGSLAEDVATSTHMLGKGWHTAFVHEPLQFGTVPEDFAGHLKQRTRWAIGTVDTAFKLKFCLYGDKVKKMTFAQRFSGALYASLNFYTLLMTMSMYAIPIVLCMGKPLVAYANDTQLRWLIRACFATTICNRLCEFVLFSPAGYHSGQRDARYQMWMSPYIALCIIRSFVLPKWLGGQAQAFKPTGSLGSALNERDPKLRKNMFHRLYAILFNYMAIYHLAFVYVILVGVCLSSYRCVATNHNTHDILLSLVTHAFWPPLTFLYTCTSLWTPISYAIDPPTMPDREQLLDRDPKTGVAHPTAASKKIAFGGQAAWFEFEHSLSTAYTILIFVVSFIV